MLLLFALTGSRRRSVRGLGLLLSLLGLLALMACGNGGGSNAPGTTASQQPPTPSGQSAPRTAFPMPPTTPTSNARAMSAHGQPGANGRGFTLLDNRHTQLSDYAGQVVVLDFYATWCPPCRLETPHLVQLQRRYGAQGLRVIGLNVGGPEDRDQVPAFVEEYGIQYALGFPDAGMTELYLSDDDRIPQAYVFDRKGQLVKRFISYDETVPAEMESVIKKALAE
ncbi:MAG TPA: TlpA disulfide reductase family protein [Pyrinomonadaceae bacterium]|jgi:thiol-disulfide isomerase/thioredoxin|nr:TlpA disulfide reductase family protein [Pyrinomonadaceae bacterium]